MSENNRTFTREQVLDLLDSIHNCIENGSIKVYDYGEKGHLDKKWWLFLADPRAHKLNHNELLDVLTRKIKATNFKTKNHEQRN